MELVWLMFAFFTMITMIFVIIALFFPEWVGITGKKALEVERHQQEEQSTVQPTSLEIDQKNSNNNLSKS